MAVDTIIKRLEEFARADALPGMARYGIDIDHCLGVSLPNIRKIAREVGRDHGRDNDVAAALWRTGIHDARLLATMVAVPGSTTLTEADAWARDFRSWDLCDQACINLFRRTKFAHDLPARWYMREEEFVRRTAYSMIATLAVHDKKAPDERFTGYFALLEAAADDPRNFVKKAVNWALRQIGKRNQALNTAACDFARTLQARDTKPARWIAADALRELESEKTLARLKD